MDFSKHLDLAKKLAVEAGKQAYEMQKDLSEIKEKDPKDIVTEADLANDKLIREEILKAYPDHGLLTEEDENINEESDFKWIVDPIDGTVNYSRGIPIWGISIGLEYKGEIVVGVVYMPVFNDLYYAEKGKGAYCNDKKISVNAVSELTKSMVLLTSRNIGSNKEKQLSFNEEISLIQDAILPNIQRSRSLGSAVYEVLLVASGATEGYILKEFGVYDVAAVVVILEEAGGVCCNLNSGSLNIYETDKGAIFTNKAVHKNLMNLLKNRK